MQPHTTNQLLDELARRLDGATDYRLAKELETSTSAVTSYRKGRSAFSQQFAVRVADKLGWRREYVMACVEHERSARELERIREIYKPEAVRVFEASRLAWANIAERFSPPGTGQTERPAPAKRRRAAGAAALLLGGIAALCATTPRQAAAAELAASVYSVKRRRGLFRDPWRPSRFARPRRRPRDRTLIAPAAPPITA